MNAVATWSSNAESWLDERGKGAWIAAMVLGFIFFWPVGLALLAYMIWSKRMFNKSCSHSGTRNDRWAARMQDRHARHMGFRSSGNSAFDAYKSETLRRLQEEQENFEAFLERLRAAKDKSEFDAFMDERATKAAADAEDTGDTGDRTGTDTGPKSPGAA